ncbi:MAG: adenine deaminase C-terminal domain-containing protein [Deltaproteobacteria bacterium]
MLMQNPAPRLPNKDIQSLIQVALGEKKADLAVVHATILNVYTGELLPDQGIGVSGQWIACVGKNIDPAIGSETHVIDAAGKTVIPGLIDGHTHLAWTATAHEFLRYIMKGGTTTLVTESLEPYPVAGLAGVLDFLASLADQPIKIFALAPAMVSISPEGRRMPMQDLIHLLELDSILGLGETYWQALLQHTDLTISRLEAAVNAGKILEGHSAGAGEAKLNAYIASGITSCHEPIQPQEVLDRLRLGLHVMVREGSIRRDLKAISTLRLTGADLRRLILATDGINPQDLMQSGYMETLVQRAIDYGFEPVQAVQMATLNVAEHFRLDHILGGIAPGRFADFLIIPNIRTIRAEVVISNGKRIAADRELEVPPRRHRYADESLASIHLDHPLQADDFAIKTEIKRPIATVRAIEMTTDLVTSEAVLQIAVTEGRIHADVGSDIIKIAAVDRTRHPGKTFTGLLKGFHLQSGAFASSAAWDTTDIIVIGTNDRDMALAVNHIRSMQGGYAVVDGGGVIADLPMPVFGLIAELPLEEIALRVSRIDSVLADRGVQFPDPMLSLITLTGAAIPFLRICEQGLVSLKTGEMQNLFIS